MTKLERFLRAISGAEVDRPPVSVWLHFASEHRSGEDVAGLHLAYFHEYDWDYLKVMNDYRHPLPGIESIECREDLLRFGPLSMETPSFAQQLRCLGRLRQELGPDTPIVETVFNPLQTIVRGAGNHALQVMLDHPDAAQHMLAAVTETLKTYVGACRKMGITGIFFSVNGANRPPADGGLTDTQFDTFVAPFDREVLDAASGLVRIGHIHGLDLVFDRVSQYPVEAFNWSHHWTAPSTAEVRSRTGAALIGGIDEARVFGQTPAEVARDIRTAIDEVGDRGLLIGPGCTVPPDTPKRILHAVMQTAQGLAAD